MSKVSFIGTGTMATAMVKCILEKNIYKPNDIMGSAPRKKRGEEIKERFSINMTQDNREAAKFGNIVVLSIKPQVFPKVAGEIKDALRENQIILSIMAGVDIKSLQTELLHKKIVRVMPNTPAQIGEGMSVWTTTKEVSDEEKEKIRQILASMGKEIFVEEEGYIDMATAVSATGPAYVFLFLEAMISAGVHLGFSRRVAKELVYQTALGSVLFAINSTKHTAQLRDMVTSPGGTTAEALYEIEKGSLRTVMEKAIYAAYKRTQYLKKVAEKQKE